MVDGAGWRSGTYADHTLANSLANLFVAIRFCPPSTLGDMAWERMIFLSGGQNRSYYPVENDLLTFFDGMDVLV